jgi:hypothetical protein
MNKNHITRTLLLSAAFFAACGDDNSTIPSSNEQPSEVAMNAYPTGWKLPDHRRLQRTLCGTRHRREQRVLRQMHTKIVTSY